MTSVNSSRALEASDLRSRILREATTLFATRGYHATSVREVVEAAGCTKPALYYYFQGKEAVFLEAIREATDAMMEIIDGANRAEGSIRARIERALEVFFATLGEHEMQMRLLMRAELRPDEGQPVFDFDSMRSFQIRKVEEIVRLGIERGEVSADVSVEDAALALSGMVDQRLRRWLAGEAIPGGCASRILRIFFDGVG